MPKSWSEKFDNGKEPIIAPSIRTILGFAPGSLMLIPIPSQIDCYLRSIPLGEDRTTAQMGRELARMAGAELTCPMCCGMFLRICAEKAFEDFEAGAPVESITPFWRMVPPGSKIRNKLSFGVEFVDRMRAAEHSDATAIHSS